jgi:hypothetical protein
MSMTEQVAVVQNPSMPEMVLDAKELPSRGVGYPEDLKFYYRSYTFGEIKKVSASNEIDLTQIIDSVMGGISVKNDNFNKFNMSFVDMLYIGLLRRVSSQGQLKYQLPYKCEGCGKVSNAVFGSGDIDFQEIDEKVTSLPLEVDLAGEVFQFTFPTVQNMLDVKIGKNSKKIKGVPVMEVTALQVVNMRYEDALKKLSALDNVEDMETLTEIDALLFHDIKPINTVCKMKVEDDNGKETTCNQANHVSIEGKELLIRPFREGERPSGTKIRFVGK